MPPPPASPPPPPPGAAPEPVLQELVDLWRSMASLWGVSPTMAQVHGLLFVTGEALSMDDLMARLGISRGNASMNLTKLVEWGLVRRAHRRGDRREYYEALGDVWEMFTVVAAQRKRRELDPMLGALRGCRERLPPTAAEPRRRVGDMVDFLTLVDGLAQRFFASHKSLRAALELLAQRDGKSTPGGA